MTLSAGIQRITDTFILVLSVGQNGIVANLTHKLLGKNSCNLFRESSNRKSWKQVLLSFSFAFFPNQQQLKNPSLGHKIVGRSGGFRFNIE